MKKLSQVGDTIVEVLIAMAVISVILGGAFAVVNNSKQSVTNSQEHAEALKLLEGQVEQLRYAAADSGASFYNSFYNWAGNHTAFCMYQSTPEKTTPAHFCTQNNSGGLPTGNDLPYTLKITCQGACDDTNGYLFNAQITWNGLGGSGQSSESILYRLYKSS